MLFSAFSLRDEETPAAPPSTLSMSTLLCPAMQNEASTFDSNHYIASTWPTSDESSWSDIGESSYDTDEEDSRIISCSATQDSFSSIDDSDDSFSDGESYHDDL